jgi:predicted  nucleic acid-binding Zn-ribbon protein
LSSIPEQIQSLEDLAAVDAALKILEDQLTQERSTLSTLKGGLSKLEEKLKTDRTHVTALDKTRNDLVTEVRTMMQQLDHSRDKLNRSRNERESNAAQRELEELRKLVRDREEENGKLTTEEESKKIAADLGAREGDIHSKLGEVEEEKKRRLSEREGIVKKLPPVLYRKYEMIRTKRSSGIAQTTDGTCRACNMALPPQLFHRLRRDPVLEQCPSCNRIIYFVPPLAVSGGKT